MLGKDGVQFGYFGQEINITTYNLCRINMFLHDVGFDKFDIACEDTLTAPQHWDDEPFELIVSNPPYSIKWAGDGDATLINDPRFAPAGVLAPKSAYTGPAAPSARNFSPTQPEGSPTPRK